MPSARRHARIPPGPPPTRLAVPARVVMPDDAAAGVRATATQPEGMQATDQHADPQQRDPDPLSHHAAEKKHVQWGDAKTPEDGLWEEVKEVSSNTQEPMRKGTISFAWNQRQHYQMVPYFIVPDAWAKDPAFLERVIDGVGLTMPNMIVNFNPIKHPVSRWNKAACLPNPPSRCPSLARLASISRLRRTSQRPSAPQLLAPPAYARSHSEVNRVCLANATGTSVACP